MWFLFVLWGFAAALWPWCHSIHLACQRLSPAAEVSSAAEQKNSASSAASGGTAAAAAASTLTVKDLLPTVGAGASVVFGSYLFASIAAPLPLENVLWLLTVPLVYVANVSCAIVGGMLRHTRPRWSRAAFVCGALSIVVGTFMLSLPPVINLGPPLSVTMYFVFSLYVLFYVLLSLPFFALN
jgi:hypothetical protein